jgi:hypothetical protein
MCFHFKLIKKQSLLLVKVLLSLYNSVEGQRGAELCSNYILTIAKAKIANSNYMRVGEFSNS